MMISSRGRYALRVMAEMAEHGNDEYIPLKELAEKQDISLKYLESIMPLLVKNGLVEGSSGKGGGYRLLRNPEDYSLGEILRITEGNLEPVSCTSKATGPCERADRCHSLPIWNELSELINGFLDNKTLKDTMEI